MARLYSGTEQISSAILLVNHLNVAQGTFALTLLALPAKRVASEIPS